MTAKPPPIPAEQRAIHDDGRAVETDPPQEKGNAGLNFKEQGRYGNLEQNVNAVQHKVQDR